MRWDEVSYRFLEDRLRVPVIEGVAAAIKLAEAMVAMGLQTSKAGSLAYPLPKTYQGNLVGYSPAYAGPLGAQSAGTICSSDRREHQVLA